MKKIFVVGLLLSSVILVSCGTQKDNSSVTQSKSTKSSDNSSQPKSTQTSDTSSQSKSSEAAKSSETSASSSETVKTSEVQGNNLTQARLALYHAGIDSSSISDEQLVKYWQAAKQEKSDFVQYVKARL